MGPVLASIPIPEMLGNFYMAVVLGFQRLPSKSHRKMSPGRGDKPKESRMVTEAAAANVEAMLLVPHFCADSTCAWCGMSKKSPHPSQTTLI